jgi:tyrosine-protein phosphatase SIW14
MTCHQYSLRCRRSLLTVLLPALLALGCDRASPTISPSTNPAHAAMRPQDIRGVENFAEVSPVLFRGAQPTEDGFAELKRRGIKTIVSLRTFNSDRDELEGHGLRYVRFYCKAWHIEDEDMARFLKVLEDPENQPVFVHCQHGSDRTGCAVAVYRMVEQGWTPEEAIAEINNFGYHPVFKNILEYLRRFEPETMRRTVSQTPAPKVEVVP